MTILIKIQNVQKVATVNSALRLGIQVLDFAFRTFCYGGPKSIRQSLSCDGQQPKIMVVACCDARVDPALILQCDPGDLFVVRNVANIVPPYEKDGSHHGTSAALEFGICFLKVEHLIGFCRICWTIEKRLI